VKLKQAQLEVLNRWVTS